MIDALKNNTANYHDTISFSRVENSFKEAGGRN
jgi:hypothetical protein